MCNVWSPLEYLNVFATEKAAGESCLLLSILGWITAQFNFLTGERWGFFKLGKCLERKEFGRKIASSLECNVNGPQLDKVFPCLLTLLQINGNGKWMTLLLHFLPPLLGNSLVMWATFFSSYASLSSLSFPSCPSGIHPIPCNFPKTRKMWN